VVTGRGKKDILTLFFNYLFGVIVSYDSTVVVVIRYQGLNLIQLGEVAEESLAAVRMNVINESFEGEADYLERDGHDNWQEELVFLQYIINQANPVVGDQSGILSWGMCHKNLIISDFIEHLAPFWKAYYALTPHSIPENILVMDTTADDTVEQYCVGKPYREDGKVSAEVAYKKLDESFNWANFNIDFDGAKRI
jgi:hypothetical protein